VIRDRREIGDVGEVVKGRVNCEGKQRWRGSHSFTRTFVI
jgi:hypothetical protein